MTEWKNLETFIDVLNKNVEYVVLRNFEFINLANLKEQNEDIDFLCADRRLFLDKIGLTEDSEKDKRHYVKIGEYIVPMDIREVGDSYYCTKWECNILKTRRYINNMYVPNMENYYYSLLYHVLIQKMEVKKAYDIKLKKMEENLRLEEKNVNRVETLASYMKKMGYVYTIPSNPRAIFNIKNVKRKLLEKSARKTIVRIINKPIIWIGKVKNTFLRRP